MTEETSKEILSISNKTKLLADVTSKFTSLIGFAVAGPIGSVAGGIAGTLVKYGLEEFMNSWLTPKEVRRVGTTTEYIIEQINKRLENNEELNESICSPLQNSEGEALFEGVLLKCKNEFQEKKLKYISNIFVNSLFNKEISPEIANQILRTVENFTYRKLCIISYFSKISNYNSEELMLEPYSSYPNIKSNPDLDTLKQDIFELINFGLITNDGTAMFTSDDINPGKFELTNLGKLYCKIMELNNIHEGEIDTINEALKFRMEFGLSDQGKENGKYP